VPGLYRPRHPERTALYRVLFHNFDRFLSEYERRFEKEYGYFRPVVQEVVERYLDCGNPRSPTKARSWSATMGFTPTLTYAFELVALMAAASACTHGEV
jgi:hypothetical protein